ncbi:MAG: hypothetical protein IKW79_01600, partial [Schwartzia sp.]|nr:hypothetical protein [Schwartzia sp. (in: firmicutes)]
VGNVWAMLGVAAGQSLANAFNSRQMGFRTEQQADEKAMEYSEMVPEFSIGGEAIYQRRAVISKINNGTIDKVNWLHPHSKSGKRFERALTGMEKSSRGYFVWEGYSLSVFGRKYSNEKVVGMYHHPQVVDRFERYLYVLGQVATAIKYDFARTRNFELRPENEVFPDGSASNTVLLLRGRGTYRKDHVKGVDTYRGVSMREAQRILDMDYGKMLDDMHNKILAGEFWNLAEARWFVQEYETRLAQYGPRGSNAEKYDAPEEREEDPRN